MLVTISSSIAEDLIYASLVVPGRINGIRTDTYTLNITGSIATGNTSDNLEVVPLYQMVLIYIAEDSEKQDWYKSKFKIGDKCTIKAKMWGIKYSGECEIANVVESIGVIHVVIIGTNSLRNNRR